MNNLLRLGLAAVLLSSSVPAFAQAQDDPILAEAAAAPIRERLLGRMEGWRKVLFPQDELLNAMVFPDKPLPGAVEQEFGARYDALEKTVRGQRHPGAVHRSRYAFQELLDDALRMRYSEDKRDKRTDARFRDYRDQKIALVESAAVLAEGRESQSRAETAAAALAAPIEALPRLPEPASLSSFSSFFDGSLLSPVSPIEAPPVAAAVPATTPEPAAILPSRSFSAWALVAPKTTPAPASSAQRILVKGRPAVEYDNGVTHVGGDRNWRNNNPGNIRSGQWSRAHGAIGAENGFAIFPTAAAGRRALDELLAGSTYRNLTLERAIGRYVAFLSRMAGVEASTKLSDFTAKQMTALKKWISTFEGTRKGAVVTLGN